MIMHTYVCAWLCGWVPENVPFNTDPKSADYLFSLHFSGESGIAKVCVPPFICVRVQVPNLACFLFKH